MLEGKMFLGLTGMPMRNSVLAKMVLAEADPEPLTVANFTTKSLIPLIADLASLQMGSDSAPARWSGNSLLHGGVGPHLFLTADRHCGGSNKPVKPALRHT